MRVATTLAYEDDDLAGHAPTSVSGVDAPAVRHADERWDELAVIRRRVDAT